MNNNPAGLHVYKTKKDTPFKLQTKWTKTNKIVGREIEIKTELRSDRGRERR